VYPAFPRASFIASSTKTEKTLDMTHILQLLECGRRSRELYRPTLRKEKSKSDTTKFKRRKMMLKSSSLLEQENAKLDILIHEAQGNITIDENRAMALSRDVSIWETMVQPRPTTAIPREHALWIPAVMNAGRTQR
jgi:hypothetical protein